MEFGVGDNLFILYKYNILFIFEFYFGFNIVVNLS